MSKKPSTDNRLCVTFQVEQYKQSRDLLIAEIKAGRVEFDAEMILAFADAFSSAVDLLEAFHRIIFELQGKKVDGRTLMMAWGDDYKIEEHHKSEDH